MPTGGLPSCDKNEIIHEVYNIIHTNIMTLEFVEYWCHKAGGLAKTMNAGMNREKRSTSKKLITYHFYRFSALFLDPLAPDPLTESKELPCRLGPQSS